MNKNDITVFFFPLTKRKCKILRSLVLQFMSTRWVLFGTDITVKDSILCYFENNNNCVFSALLTDGKTEAQRVYNLIKRLWEYH